MASPVAPWGGTVTVEWRTMQDSKVRPAHATLDGATAQGGPRGKLPEFNMDGRVANYPGDPRLPAALRVNCRCELLIIDEVDLGIVVGRPAVSGPPPRQVEVVDGQLRANPQPTQAARQWVSEPLERSVTLDEVADRAYFESIGFPVEELEALAERVGGTLRVGISNNSGRVGGKSFGVTIQQADGDEILFARRQIFFDDSGNLAVYNSELEVMSGFQGQGVGTEFLDAMTSWYRQMGVRTEALSTIDVGGYAWAKAGYDWDPLGMAPRSVLRIIDRSIGNMARGRADIDKIMGLLPDEVSDPEVAGALREFIALRQRVQRAMSDGVGFDAEDFPLPIEIAQVGWKPGAQTWPGKEGMLGSFWDGVRYLS